MISKEEAQYFSERPVKISLKNDYLYRGRIVKIFESSMIIDDVKQGETVIPFEQVRSINWLKEKKGEGYREDAR